jgi:hypothetical protein
MNLVMFFLVGSESDVLFSNGAVVGLERGYLFLEAVNEDGETRLLTEGPLEQVLARDHEHPVLPILVGGGGAAAACIDRYSER